MSAKAILVFCAQALVVQSALSQCTSRAAIAAEPGFIAPAGLAAPYGITSPGLGGSYGYAASSLAAPYGFGAQAAPCACACPAMDFTPTSGGGLPVTSASAIAPVGLSVASENAYDGILAAAGELPFVGTVAVEGVLPTAGAGAVNHACGNGINAMVSETAAFAPGYAGAAFAPGYAGAAYSPSFAASGYAAPGFAAPALGYRAGFAGKGCGCAL